MRYVAVNTEKEMLINAVPNNFAFLEIACNVREASVYHGLRTYERKTSMFNREGE